jgi:hypothetical protein
MQRILADGHELHGTAYHFVDLTTLDIADLMTEFNLTETAFQNDGVCRRPKLFRPPYATFNPQVTQLHAWRSCMCVLVDCEYACVRAFTERVDCSVGASSSMVCFRSRAWRPVLGIASLGSTSTRKTGCWLPPTPIPSLVP